MNFILSGPIINTEQGELIDTALHVKSGVISALEKNISTADSILFPKNYHIVPGFIDMHVHGANGHDVMDADSGALRAISHALAVEGTTGFLATTMTADIVEIDRALITVRDFMRVKGNRGAVILGVHLEGPFLAATKMGAQRGDKIILPSIELVQHWQQLSNNVIKQVTLAPEQANAIELIQYLVHQNIIASIGHTNATYAETTAAIVAGCSHATHLFNAMRGIHQREPGTVTAALLSPEVSVELILDGVHVHPAVIELTHRLKGANKIILVTDAMRAKCLGDGCYDLGGQSVHVKNNIAQLSDGTLAGSVLTMSDALRNMMKFTGCSLMDALKMTSENPARALGIFDKKGSIAIGKDADLVVLDDSLNVVMTICGGEVCYQRE
jgi:N-acetylglucosamine-6-phosphate deacetylase